MSVFMNSGFTAAPTDDERYEPQNGLHRIAKEEAQKLAYCDWLMDGPAQPQSFYRNNERVFYDYPLEWKLAHLDLLPDLPPDHFGLSLANLEEEIEAAECEELAGYEVEDVWRMRQSPYTYGGAEGSSVRPGKNSRRPLIGDRGGRSRLYFNKTAVLAEVLVDSQRYRV